jgi:hypothetical protein
MARTRTSQRSRATARARAARYTSLQNDLDEAQLDLERGLREARDDEKLQSAAVGDFLRELVRVCRADSRLLNHLVAQRWIRHARGWGWRELLRKMHRGLEKGVKRPWSASEVVLWAEIDQRRHPEDGGRPASLETIRRALAKKGLIPRDLGTSCPTLKTSSTTTAPTAP